MTDSYTARDAAAILGRSERLVRKLAADGRLEIIGTDPLTVSQESVHRERSKRKTREPRTRTGPSSISDDERTKLIQETAQQVAAAMIEQMLPKMLETRDKVEERLTTDLAQARQQIDALSQELSELRAQTPPPRRGLFRRAGP